MYRQCVDIIPVVFSVTGMASKNQKGCMKKIPGYSKKLFASLQMAVILEATFILWDIDL